MEHLDDSQRDNHSREIRKQESEKTKSKHYKIKTIKNGIDSYFNMKTLGGNYDKLLDKNTGDIDYYQ